MNSKHTNQQSRTRLQINLSPEDSVQHPSLTSLESQTHCCLPLHPQHSPKGLSITRAAPQGSCLTACTLDLTPPRLHESYPTTAPMRATHHTPVGPTLPHTLGSHPTTYPWVLPHHTHPWVLPHDGPHSWGLPYPSSLLDPLKDLLHPRLVLPSHPPGPTLLHTYNHTGGAEVQRGRSN